MIRVAAISLKRRHAVLNNGGTVPIQNMRGADGERTNDPDECMFAIVKLSNWQWECCDMRDFDAVLQ